ncbi:MAG: gfo/Idh/MocA family oxidoreductase [Candidatus Latescibacterota bacterium]|nr:MAG: gfo/Idh/MocA family oxidoreductase [Candidatus Latescibacterota bacterium]
MDKVKVGIIGAGGMGAGHANTMKSVDEVELTAVCDVEKRVAEQVAEEHQVRAFTDYKALIDSGLADAVIVATPHYFHPPISIYAMKRGLHVLSEKPVAVTVAAADQMNKTAQQTGVKYAVMYQNRSVPLYRAVKRLIEEGRLGKLYRTCFIDPHYRSQAYYDSAPWRATWKGEGGGVLLNQAPHGIDIFTWLAGLPVRVMAKTRTRRHKIEVEDEASAMLEYANGAIGYYHTSVNEWPGGSYMELCGETGKIVIANGKLRFHTLETPIQEFTEKNDQMWASPPLREEEVVVEETESGHKAIIRNFARAILYNEPLLSPGVEGVVSLEFINALVLSGKKNEPVEIPVNRDEYDELIEELKKRSKAKKVSGPTKRITDPHHLV